MCATCSARHTLLDFCHPNNVGQRLQLLKFLIMELLSSHVTSLYAQIFYPQPCQARWLVTYIWKVPYLNLRQDVSIMTDSLDMSVFGLVEPEEGGTKIHHNAGNYTHTHDTASLPRRTESSDALFSAKFPERLLLFMPNTLNLQPNFTYFILTFILTCASLLVPLTTFSPL